MNTVLYIPSLAPDQLRELASRSCVYLGLDHQACLRLAAIQENGNAPLPTTALFRQTANRLIADLERGYTRMLQEASPDKRQLYQIAECNLFNAPSARNAVLYFMFLELVSVGHDTVFLVDLPRLWNFMLSRHGDDPRFRFAPAVPVLVAGRDLEWEAEAYMCQAAARRETPPADIGASTITVLQCWSTLALARRGDSLALHYGPLPEHLEKLGEDVRPLFILLEQDEAYMEAKRLLRAAYPKAIFPEDMLAQTDLEAIARRACADIAAFGPVILESIDVTDLLDPLDFKGGGHPACMALAYASVFERLRGQGIQVRKFIYLFENQNWERQCLRGLRDFHPGCRTIGFQHTQIPTLWGLRPPHGVSALLTAPDRIVCNGENSFRHMAPSWQGQSEVVVGPALRHAYLHGKHPGKEASGQMLGVAGCCLPSQTVYMCCEVYKVLRDMPHWSALIKFHPDNSPETMRQALASIRADRCVSSRVTVFEGKQDQFLASVSVLTAPGTSLLTDAALLGIPTFQFGAFHDFDIIYMGLEQPLVDDAQALANALRKIPATGARVPKTREAVSAFYHPITGLSLQVFQ